MRPKEWEKCSHPSCCFGDLSIQYLPILSKVRIRILLMNEKDEASRERNAFLSSPMDGVWTQGRFRPAFWVLIAWSDVCVVIMDHGPSKWKEFVVFFVWVIRCFCGRASTSSADLFSDGMSASNGERARWDATAHNFCFFLFSDLYFRQLGN